MYNKDIQKFRLAVALDRRTFNWQYPRVASSKLLVSFFKWSLLKNGQLIDIQIYMILFIRWSAK